MLDPIKDAKLISRLQNAKFGTAREYELRDDHPEEVRTLVIALARMFDNVGVFGGDVGTLVTAALNSILPEKLS